MSWFRHKPPPVCQVCKGPATQSKSYAPWPDSKYAHKSYTCDAHASYLHGVPWITDASGTREATSTESTVSFCYCQAPYGACEHSREAATKFHQWDAKAEFGRLP